MSEPPLPEFNYVRLGAFTYNVVLDPSAATEFIQFWLQREHGEPRVYAYLGSEPE